MFPFRKKKTEPSVKSRIDALERKVEELSERVKYFSMLEKCIEDIQQSIENAQSNNQNNSESDYPTRSFAAENNFYPNEDYKAD